MTDWIVKLDDFLKLAERDVLKHAGNVSHEDATRKAMSEYEAFDSKRVKLPTRVEKHFEAAIVDVKQLEKTQRATTRATKGAKK